MTTTASTTRLHTIGSVCRRLQGDFPDISISKIRYLEDQGLLAPKRTRGGYRLFSEEDIERLETILRLQRDEFLPLRVIRQELASPSSSDRKRRRGGLSARGTAIDATRPGVGPKPRSVSAIVPPGRGTSSTGARSTLTPKLFR